MPKKEAPAAGLVHLYPDGYYHITGVPHVECDVTPDEAERLLAFTPAAFHTTKPELVGPLTQAPDEAVPSPEKED